MRTVLYSHASCLAHSNGVGHPERAERIPAAVAGVLGSGLDVIERDAPLIDIDAIHTVHDPSYVESIELACASGGRSLDADTGVVAESWEASLRAAGAGLAAVDALRAGEAEIAFLAVRPPGHHALHSRAMGFCLFNNIAITAAAIAAAGDSVAILDWDVHHGNGTQDTFYSSDILYVSLHQFPFYPGTGWLDEIGAGSGRGYTVNIPLPAGSGGEEVRLATERIVEPVISEFSPEWLLISAGYDAHVSDPLAGLTFRADDYGWMAQRIVSGYPGRSILFLEGGYDVDAIRTSVGATLRGCAGESFDPPSGTAASGSERVIEMAADSAARHWRSVQAD